MNKKKILITGGTGFIGNAILKILSSHDYELLCLSRKYQKKTKNIIWIKSSLNLSKLDLLKVKNFNPYALIHLSWEKIPDFSEKVCNKNYKDNIIFFNKIKKVDSLKKIIITGSCFEYKNKSGKKKEDNKVNLIDNFPLTKYKTYKELKKIFGNKIKFAWFRVFFAYGPNQRKGSLIPYLINSLEKKEPVEIKNPYSMNDFIFVNDIAKIIKKSLTTNFISGIYNLGSGKLTKIMDIIKIIEQYKKKKIIVKLSNNNKRKLFYADMTKTITTFKIKNFVKLNAGIKKTLLKIKM
jgi:nucleoside-diphosphate-sugar epimerase